MTTTTNDNETTEALDRAGAVQLAQDVLLHLDSGKLNAHVYGYFHPSPWPLRLDMAQEAQSYLARPEVVCSVCAVGALFVAEVLRNDACSMSTAINENDLRFDRLKPYFGAHGVKRIEAAYELWSFPDRDGNPDLALCAFQSNHDGGESETDRLRAIMQNIVDHGGTFTPETEPVPHA